MKKMMTLLLVLCLLPVTILAENTTGFGTAEIVHQLVIQDGGAVYETNADLDLDKEVRDYYYQTCYRPIKYITHYNNGETVTTMEPVAMLTIKYTYYYGINKAGQYVMAGGNPVPTLTPIAPAVFSLSVAHGADTQCNAVQLSNFAGYTYTFSGGYFTMDYYDVIHLDEDGNIIRKELNIGQQIAYSCTFTIS